MSDKKYKYNRYTIRLSDDMDKFVKETANKMSLSPTSLIKYALGEYREEYEKEEKE